MIERDLYLVVMAGGSGTRFWPKSTRLRPKQLLSFGADQETLLVQTLGRFDGLVSKDARHRMIVTTQTLQAPVLAQAPGVTVLAEPQGRNTAPCVYWAAREVASRNPKGVMLVMPSDHRIADARGFLKVVDAAAQWAAEHGDLVTLGVAPTRAETGYGYLRTGDELAKGCRRVDAFVEKPDARRAAEFFSAGNYLWNGGMFLWRADAILAAFDLLMPEMRKIWEAAGGDAQAAYPQLTATSVDYGIMEKAKNVVTFSLDCGWDDLGSWTSLENLADSIGSRKDGNVVMSGQTVAVDAQGNIVDAPSRLVALLGVNDLIIVEHGGSILVADKARAQDIRLIVEQVKKLNPEQA